MDNSGGKNPLKSILKTVSSTIVDQKRGTISNLKRAFKKNISDLSNVTYVYDKEKGVYVLKPSSKPQTNDFKMELLRLPFITGPPTKSRVAGVPSFTLGNRRPNAGSSLDPKRYSEQNPPCYTHCWPNCRHHQRKLEEARSSIFPKSRKIAVATYVPPTRHSKYPTPRQYPYSQSNENRLEEALFPTESYTIVVPTLARRRLPIIPKSHTKCWSIDRLDFDNIQVPKIPPFTFKCKVQDDMVGILHTTYDEPVRRKTPKLPDNKNNANVQTEPIYYKLPDETIVHDQQVGTDPFTEFPIAVKSGSLKFAITLNKETQLHKNEFQNFEMVYPSLVDNVIGAVLKQAQWELMEEEELEDLKAMSLLYEFVRDTEVIYLNKLKKREKRIVNEKVRQAVEERARNDQMKMQWQAEDRPEPIKDMEKLYGGDLPTLLQEFFVQDYLLPRIEDEIKSVARVTTDELLYDIVFTREIELSQMEIRQALKEYQPWLPAVEIENLGKPLLEYMKDENDSKYNPQLYADTVSPGLSEEANRISEKGAKRRSKESSEGAPGSSEDSNEGASLSFSSEGASSGDEIIEQPKDKKTSAESNSNDSETAIN